MAENTKIEWCHSTFNPWRGCTRVSEGCRFCYAEAFSGRNPKVLGEWGPSGTRVVAAEAQWREPLRWNKAAAAAGERHRVFCASLADVFEQWDGPMVDSSGERLYHPHNSWEDRRPWIAERDTGSGEKPITMDTVRARLLCLIHQTPNLDWLFLTKRPEHIPATLARVGELAGDGGELAKQWAYGSPMPNLWLGTSVENQAAADLRIPHLLAAPAAVRFLSCEPLLGPVELRPKAPDSYGTLGELYRHVDPSLFGPASDRVLNCFPRIDWVIAGGESGPDARPMAVEWARHLVSQCKAAGVACFVKQLGQNVRATAPTAADWPAHVGFAAGDFPPGAQVIGLKDRKGGDPAEWPADLRVRQFPERTEAA